MKIEYTKDGVNFGGEFISLVDITTNVNNAKIKADKLVLVTLCWPMTRSFDGAEERVIVPKKNVDKFIDMIAEKYIYFGEIAGKHSEICGTLKREHISVNTNKSEVNNFLSIHPSGHDYNHSFLDVFNNGMMDGEYEDVSEEQRNEFLKLY